MPYRPSIDHEKDLKQKVNSQIKRPHPVNTPYINQNSRKIVNQKRTTNASVHERLDYQAVQKQKVAKRMEDKKENNNTFFLPHQIDEPMGLKTKRSKKKVSKSFTRAGTSQDRSNQGVRLYNKGMKQIELKEQKHREAMMKEQEKVDEDLTFHPRINPISRYFGRQPHQRLEDHLLQKGMEVKEKLEKKRSAIHFGVQNEFDFKPKVCEKSERMVEDK